MLQKPIVSPAQPERAETRLSPGGVLTTDFLIILLNDRSVYSCRHKKGKAGRLPFLSAGSGVLSFGVLEPLSGALLAVLLALFHSGVAGEQTFLLQRGAERLAQAHQRPGDSMTQRAGLPCRSTAVNGRLDRKFP